MGGAAAAVKGVGWAAGAVAGGVAVAADMFFLVCFAAAWLDGGARRKGGRARGITALVAKVVVPPAALFVMAAAGVAKPAALAAGALALAAWAPLWLGWSLAVWGPRPRFSAGLWKS
jgi:hypothetical protein